MEAKEIWFKIDEDKQMGTVIMLGIPNEMLQVKLCQIQALV